MATNLNYDATHAIAYPSKVLAQNGGAHIYNIELGAACDNGAIVKKGDFIETTGPTGKHVEMTILKIEH